MLSSFLLYNRAPVMYPLSYSGPSSSGKSSSSPRYGQGQFMLVMWHILANEMGGKIWREPLGKVSSPLKRIKSGNSLIFYIKMLMWVDGWYRSSYLVSVRESTWKSSPHIGESRAEKRKEKVHDAVVQPLNWPTHKSASFLTSVIQCKELAYSLSWFELGFSH